MIKHLIFTCTCALALASANADEPTLKNGTLLLKTGDYTLDFREKAAWTIGNFTYMGKTLISFTGGNQTVINVVRPVQTDPEAWIGSAHGREEVESVVLRVDGKEFPITSSFSAPQGEEYTLIKKSRLGPFLCNTETRLNAGGVEQTISFQADKSIDEVRYAYVFMHCWNYRLEDWLALLPDGEKLQDRFPTDQTTSLKRDISALALYSEADELGVVMTYEQPYEGDPLHSNFLINWPERHNKHYFRTLAKQMDGSTYKCRIEGFSATPGGWVEKALELSKTHWPPKN